MYSRINVIGELLDIIDKIIDEAIKISVEEPSIEERCALLDEVVG